MSVKKKPSLSAMTMAAIGVVFGDIGTSPLYTLRECLKSLGAGTNDPAALFGFLSLIFWLLTLIVSIKYIVFVMRADNEREGGILTLMSLAIRHLKPGKTKIIILLGLVGGSFFYGDGVITPAISVLSAIEGMEIIAPSLAKYVVPLAITVLTILFVIQKKGTGIVGKLFAPVMLLWFGVIALMGISAILKHPAILQALNPWWAMNFFISYHAASFSALGMVVLAVTGAEALYADMGHFGKQPIQLGWFSLVMPALILNYFGQGALLLSDPTAIQNPFFLLAPEWAIAPLLILATLATVIASQAVISGVFSMTRQAVRLGYLPPMRIVHTSEDEFGQVYIPVVNWLLFAAVVIVIMSFQQSGALASAYGIVVTGTMALTSVLLFIVARHYWNWSLVKAGVMLCLMLLIDLPLFSANLSKLFTGGWLPVLLGLLVLSIMLTWKSERSRLLGRLREDEEGLQALIATLEKDPPVRVKGTAVIMVRASNAIPLVLLHNLKHNKVLHERVVLLNVVTENAPYVHRVKRLDVESLSSSFWRVTARYGWRETPNMADILYRCGLAGLGLSINDTSFFLSRDTLVMGKRPWYLRLRGRVFQVFQRNALRTPDLFEIPPNRVVELGSQVEF